jgi:uncharacterized DUF497 family protein
MRFEWDEDKNRSNIAQHKVSFSAAMSVFDDQHALSVLDRGAYLGGTTAKELIRIIWARKATPSERRAYEENQHPA